MQFPKKTIIAIHIIGWLIFLALPVFFIQAQSPEKILSTVISSGSFWIFILTYLFLYYLNVLFLLPRLYFKKQTLIYAVSVLLLIVLVWFIHPFDNMVKMNNAMNNRPPPPDRFRIETNNPPPPFNDKERIGPRVDIVSIFLGIVVLAMGIAVKTVEEWQATKQKLSLTETDKLNAELSFLKAQINPHFLFNTLNNLYTLAITKNEKTAEGIMGLSNIMRYVTDDATADFVPLQKEIDCINDFIELQRLRLNEMTTINFSVPGNTEHKRIAPLLFMTFVENCFKYGTSNRETSPIKIRIECTDDAIIFSSENNIYNRLMIVERKGVGLQNVKQRLQHLYPGQHQLSITEAAGVFNVSLTIKD
jgi:two-component system, LytTR family, sensor kinase